MFLTVSCPGSWHVEQRIEQNAQTKKKQQKQRFIEVKVHATELERAQTSGSRVQIVMFLGYFIKLKEHSNTPKYPLEASDRSHPIGMKNSAQDQSEAPCK